MGGTAPPVDLGGFISPPCENQSPFDLIVVGLQEIGSGSNREQWNNALIAHLNLAYEGRWSYVALHLLLSSFLLLPLSLRASCSGVQSLAT